MQLLKDISKSRIFKSTATRLKNRVAAHVNQARILKWRLLARLGGRIEASHLPETTVILLAFARMHNMEALARTVLKVGGVHRVIISNNNPKYRITDWVHVRDPRLRLIDQPRPSGCSKRFEIARDAETNFFLAIDDDIFLYPDQITHLLEQLARRPDVPHGIQGSEYGIADIERPDRIRHFFSQNQCVDLLHTVYAFTKEHVHNYFQNFELARKQGLENLDICDDIILSHSGRGRAEIHDVGSYLYDPSYNSEQIAVFRQPQYIASRARAMVFFRTGDCP